MQMLNSTTDARHAHGIKIKRILEMFVHAIDARDDVPELFRHASPRMVLSCRPLEPIDF